MSGQAARSEDVLRATDRAPGAANPDSRSSRTPTSRHGCSSARRSRCRSRRPASRCRMLRAHPDVIPPDLIGLTDRTLLETLTLGSLGRAHLLAGDLRRGATSAAAHPGIAGRAVLGVPRAPAGHAGAPGGVVGPARHRAEARRRGAAARARRRTAGAPRAGRRLPGLLAGGDPSRPAAGGVVRTTRGRRARGIEPAARSSCGSRTSTGSSPADRLLPRTSRSRPLPRSCGMPSTPLAPCAAPGRRPSARFRRVQRGWSAMLVESVAGRARRRGGWTQAHAMLDAAAFAPREDLPARERSSTAVLTAWLAHAEGRAAESRRHADRGTRARVRARHRLGVRVGGTGGDQARREPAPCSRRRSARRSLECARADVCALPPNDI